ncbi:MAG: MoaD/ThiS family protein [Luminiphilus sp.]|nr:MoaD/ThiS family protein [Luminiphilus sp.]
MITIKFFSLIREAVEMDGLSLEWSLDLGSVAMVKAELSKRGANWGEALSHPNLIQAVNHKVVFEDNAVADGDELAFFPPMTGG